MQSAGQTEDYGANVRTVGLRSPHQVMQLERLGSFFQTPISFMRSLIRLMSAEKWTFDLDRFALDENGYGRAVYRIGTPGAVFSFVAFSHHLDPEERTDRVIAEKWDATFVLYDGVVSDQDLERLEQNAPRQEAGRYTARELVLSRANKSVRLFDHVISRLAKGLQPEAAQLSRIGYLMRTTAVYGNGKFGMCDYAKLRDRGVLDGSFQAEMLTVYMIRHFSVTLAEHVAKSMNPEGAALLAPPLRRVLGIGNSTGLGMAPFLIKHPILIHTWIHARETALARVRSIGSADARERSRFADLLARARAHLGEWSVEDTRQQARIETLRGELADLERRLQAAPGDLLPESLPWDRVYRLAESTFSLEGQEFVVSLLLETCAPLLTDLERTMSTGAIEKADPVMRLDQLRTIIEQDYAWALAIDFTKPGAQLHFWYYSQDKEEPRRGRRFEEPGAECEMRLGFGLEISRLHRELSGLAPDELQQSTAEFLLQRPNWRAAVRRIQTLHHYPYGEIHANLLGEECLPIDLLRCKLSFFGATKWDPKSDLWTRITLYQGAPHIDELETMQVDDWAFPVAGTL